MSCNIFSNKKIDLESFKIIRKRRFEYDTKIHEDLNLLKLNNIFNLKALEFVFKF